MKISIIVAASINDVIGNDNDMLWHISKDLKRFKELTSGNPVIMGRKTFYSLPEAFRPLKNRKNIVISESITDIPGCTVVKSFHQAMGEMKEDKENFIIGGGEIYRKFIDIADTIYLTRINSLFGGDITFPKIEKNKWKQVSSEIILDDDNDFIYSFETYKRKLF